MRLDPSSETSDRHTFLRVVAGILAALATPSAVRDLYGMLRGDSIRCSPSSAPAPPRSSRCADGSRYAGTSPRAARG